MAILSLIGDDTIMFNNDILTCFSAGEVAKLSYTSDLATVKTGKNSNTIYAYNASGTQASFEIKVLKGSLDDDKLQGRLQTYRDNPVGYYVDTVILTKLYGDGKGVIRAEKYILEAGIPVKQVEATVNVEGDTDQAISVYTWIFNNAIRSQAVSPPVVPVTA